MIQVRFLKAKKHPSQQKVHFTIARASGDLSKVLARILSSHANSISVRKLEELLRLGNVSAVLDELKLDELDAKLGVTKDELTRILALGARTAKEELKSEIEFDILHEAAQKWIDKHGAELIAQVSASQREAVNEVVRNIVARGWHPKEAAKLIQQSVGLHSRYAQAVMNYYRTMIDTGVPKQKAMANASEYADRLRAQRAKTIARTEAMKAVNQGRTQYWKQLQERGAFTGKRIMQEWLTSPDERLCPICEPMDGQRRPIGEPFVAGDGTLVDAPPVHPNCRCTVRIVEVRR